MGWFEEQKARIRAEMDAQAQRREESTDLRAEMERLKSERGEAVRHAEALDTQVDALRQEVANKDATLSQWAESINRLRQEVEGQRLRAQQAEAERDSARQELSEVLEVLGALTTESAVDAARRLVTGQHRSTTAPACSACGVPLSSADLDYHDCSCAGEHCRHCVRRHEEAASAPLEGPKRLRIRIVCTRCGAEWRDGHAGVCRGPA